MDSGLSKLVRDAARRPVKTTSRYSKPGARIMVAGIGGGGNNTINRLVQIGIQGAECIAVNTDQQHLDHVQAHKKMLIGKTITRGLGTGGFPELGAAAAEESRQDLTNLLRGVDLLFIAAGLGGGTGTGAAPVVAEIAKQKYTMGIVHEIKTPIVAVQSLLTIVHDKYLGPINKAIEEKPSIVFMGDSCTEIGRYDKHLKAIINAQYPTNNFTYANFGLPDGLPTKGYSS